MNYSEIDYNNDYARGLEELECLRKHTIMLPIAMIKVNNLRSAGKERQANVLEYEARFKFYMKKCEKEWHYKDPRGEQSLTQFAHDELGRLVASEREQGRGR